MPHCKVKHITRFPTFTCRSDWQEHFWYLDFFCPSLWRLSLSFGYVPLWRKDTGFAGCLIWVLTAVSTSCLSKINCGFVHSLCCPTAQGMHCSPSLHWSFVWMQSMPPYLCILCAPSANTWWLPPIKPCSEGFWLNASDANIFIGPISIFRNNIRIQAKVWLGMEKSSTLSSCKKLFFFSVSFFKNTLCSNQVSIPHSTCSIMTLGTAERGCSGNSNKQHTR